jgi:hypothetical protein
MNWHRAQTNIGIAKFTYEDPEFRDFVDNLDRINALADEAPGFVWRFVQEDEYEAGRESFEDENVLFNMSVWESKDALLDYVYHTDHVNILRRRAEWFRQLDRPIMVMWWVPAGTLPTAADARRRLDLLAEKGPTAEAFTFRHFFEAPDARETASG